MSEPVTHYDVLQVRPDATESQIRSAYKKLSRRHHPDMNPGNTQQATEAMAKINASYDVLSDPEQRKEYDISLAPKRAEPPPPPPPPPRAPASPPRGFAETVVDDAPHPRFVMDEPEPTPKPRRRPLYRAKLDDDQVAADRAFLILLARRLFVAAVVIGFLGYLIFAPSDDAPGHHEWLIIRALRKMFKGW